MLPPRWQQSSDQSHWSQIISTFGESIFTYIFRLWSAFYQYVLIFMRVCFRMLSVFHFFFVKSVNVTKRYWSHRHCQLTRELKKIPAAVIWETRKMISYQRGLNRTQKGRWQGWGLSSVAEHLPNMNEAYKLWGLNLTPSATKNKNLMVPER